MDINDIQFTNEDLVELFELAKAATEKALDPESELYKWFHDESNIADAKENSNARSETNK